MNEALFHSCHLLERSLENVIPNRSVFSNLDSRNYATLSFSDGSQSVQLEVELGSGCEPGDANADNLINVLDIVSTTNLILSEAGEYNPCSDVNNDGDINVLDVVALVNLILSGRN